MLGNTAVAATAARLGMLDNYATFQVGADPAVGWVALDRVEIDGYLDSWFTVLLARHQHKGLAGSLLGGALAHAVVKPTVTCLVVEGRCPDPAAGNVAAWRDEEGTEVRCAVLGPTVAVLPSDPAAGEQASIVLADEEALLRWWAVRTSATLTPLLAAVRARAPFGLPGLWGGVGDEVVGTALWIGQLAGRPPAQIWAFAQRLLDALDAEAPVNLPRGRAFPVTHRTGQRWFGVRATCCLYYRSAVETAPVHERHCSTCPLRDDPSRHQLLSDYLASLTADD